MWMLSVVDFGFVVEGSVLAERRTQRLSFWLSSSINCVLCIYDPPGEGKEAVKTDLFLLEHNLVAIASENEHD